MRKMTIEVLCALFLVGCATTPVAPVTPGTGVEKYSATAQVGSGAGSGNIPVIITIRSYSSNEEVGQLVSSLRAQGSDGLVDAVRTLNSKGNFAPAQMMSQELKVIRSVPTTNGRQVRMVTDRPIGFLEGMVGARSLTYQTGIVVMNLDKNGKGDGQMLVAARISFDQGGELVIEHFDVQPILLTDIQPLAY
jgi:hypothetical protein